MSDFFSPGIRVLWFVMALISFVYAGIVFAAHSGTSSCIIWISIGLVFSFYFFLAGDRWESLNLILKALISVISIILLIIFGLGQFFMLKWFNATPDPNLDYIIVLGAQMKDDGPSTVYKYRLDAAYNYLYDNKNTIVIVTGGKGKNEPISEGEGGKAYLESLGVKSDRIIVENRSMTTAENITNALVKTRIGSKSKIGIVTNNFHVYRGVQIAKKKTSAKVCGIPGGTTPLFLPNNMTREVFGIVKDLLQNNMKLR